MLCTYGQKILPVCLHNEKMLESLSTEPLHVINAIRNFRCKCCKKLAHIYDQACQPKREDWIYAIKKSHVFVVEDQSKCFTFLIAVLTF